MLGRRKCAFHLDRQAIDEELFSCGRFGVRQHLRRKPDLAQPRQCHLIAQCRGDLAPTGVGYGKHQDAAPVLGDDIILQQTAA